MGTVQLGATGWVSSVPAARLEALLCLVRSVVLLFTATSLAAAQVEARGPVAVHLVAAAVWTALVLPLARARSERAVRRFGQVTTAVDVLLYAGYCAAVTGRPGLGSLYGVLVLLLGPLRWGVRGLLATALPVAVVAVVWPVPDVAGDAPGPLLVVALVLLLGLPAAGVARFWRRSGARLRQAQELFQACFEQASIGMALLDDALVVRQANSALSGLLGVPVEQLCGSALPDRVVEQDRPAVVAALRGLPSSPHAVRLEVLFARPDGERRWGLLAASWLAGGPGVPARAVAQVENITERKRRELALAHQAEHDELTGLPNRAALRARVEADLARGRRPGLLFLDLDRLKAVNDTLGHAAGDRLLTAVADRLRTAVRPGDLVARLGGDEFVVLAERAQDPQQMTALAERVLAALEPPVELGPEQRVAVTSSAGLAVAADTSTFDSLLSEADGAMYAAKSEGGARLHVHDRLPAQRQP